MAQTFAGAGAAAQPTLLATFVLRDTLCGVDAAGVQEVMRLTALTRVREAPREVLGIINLRGRIVTVLDAGLKLGFSRAEPGSQSRVFILEDRNEYLGLLVDRVSEVIELDPERMEPVPATVPAAASRFFRGVYRDGDRVIALLNSGEILSEKEQ